MTDPDSRVATPPEPITAPRVEPPRAEPPRRPVPVAPGAPIEERFRLSAHRNKAGRVSDHASGLVDDVKEWAELRIELVRKEVERRIEGRLSTVKNQAVVGALAAMTGYFALFALAFGLGALFGHPAWGFLAVTVLFAIATAVAKRKLMPGKVSVKHSKKTGKIEVRHDPEGAEAKEREEKERVAKEQTPRAAA